MEQENQKINTNEFDYESLWNAQEEKIAQKTIKELPRGKPRTGIKGKWIKRKGHVTRNQIKNSYIRGFKSIKKEI